MTETAKTKRSTTAKPTAKKPAVAASSMAAPAAEKKAPAKKAPAKPATAKSTAAAKKPAAVKKPAVKRALKAAAPVEIITETFVVMSDEQRYRMVAEAAYFHAESHNFQSDPVRDWIEAEKDIAALLGDKRR